MNLIIKENFTYGFGPKLGVKIRKERSKMISKNILTWEQFLKGCNSKCTNSCNHKSINKKDNSKYTALDRMQVVGLENESDEMDKACPDHKDVSCPSDCPQTLNKISHKGIERLMDFGKPVLPKRKGEDDFQRRVRHHMEHVDRHPGGRDQAVAIAANEAGVSKSLVGMYEMYDKYWLDKFLHTSLADEAINIMEECLKLEEESLLPENNQNIFTKELEREKRIWKKQDELKLKKKKLELKLAKLKAKKYAKKSITVEAIDILKSSHKNRMKKLADKFEEEYKEDTGESKDHQNKMKDIVETISDEYTEKAITTRNFIVPRIDVLRARYDHDVLRSAQTIPTNKFSASTLPENGLTKNKLIHRSLCNAHGISYKSSGNCPACVTAKALEKQEIQLEYPL